MGTKMMIATPEQFTEVTLDKIIGLVRGVIALNAWSWLSRKTPLTAVEYRTVLCSLLRDTLNKRPMNVRERLIVYRTGNAQNGSVTVAVELVTVPLGVARLLVKQQPRRGDDDRKTSVGRGDSSRTPPVPVR
jgi:hypothetical protein